MKTDVIREIGIDAGGRLYIKPATQKLRMIWLEGAEVHWDEKGQFLFSPKPREWSYVDWYKHILDVVAYQNVALHLASDTCWVGIPAELKAQILTA